MEREEKGRFTECNKQSKDKPYEKYQPQLYYMAHVSKHVVALYPSTCLYGVLLPASEEFSPDGLTGISLGSCFKNMKRDTSMRAEKIF